jgi:hypothetical protein
MLFTASRPSTSKHGPFSTQTGCIIAQQHIFIIKKKSPLLNGSCFLVALLLQGDSRIFWHQQQEK